MKVTSTPAAAPLATTREQNPWIVEIVARRTRPGRRAHAVAAHGTRSSASASSDAITSSVLGAPVSRWWAASTSPVADAAPQLGGGGLGERHDAQLDALTPPSATYRVASPASEIGLAGAGAGLEHGEAGGQRVRRCGTHGSGDAHAPTSSTSGRRRRRGAAQIDAGGGLEGAPQPFGTTTCRRAPGRRAGAGPSSGRSGQGEHRRRSPSRAPSPPTGRCRRRRSSRSTCPGPARAHWVAHRTTRSSEVSATSGTTSQSARLRSSSRKARASMRGIGVDASETRTTFTAALSRSSPVAADGDDLPRDVGPGRGERGGAHPRPEVVLGPHPGGGDADHQVPADAPDGARQTTARRRAGRARRRGGPAAGRGGRRRARRAARCAAPSTRRRASVRPPSPNAERGHRAPAPLDGLPRRLGGLDGRRVAGEAHRQQAVGDLPRSRALEGEGDGVVALVLGGRAARCRAGCAAAARAALAQAVMSSSTGSSAHHALGRRDRRRAGSGRNCRPPGRWARRAAGRVERAQVEAPRDRRCRAEARRLQRSLGPRLPGVVDGDRLARPAGRVVVGEPDRRVDEVEQLGQRARSAGARRWCGCRGRC